MQTQKQNEEQFCVCKTAHSNPTSKSPAGCLGKLWLHVGLGLLWFLPLHIYMLSQGKGLGNQNNAALYQPNLAASWSRYVSLLCLGAHPSENSFSEERKHSSWLLLVEGRQSGHCAYKGRKRRLQRGQTSTVQTSGYLLPPLHCPCQGRKADILLVWKQSTHRPGQIRCYKISYMGISSPPSYFQSGWLNYIYCLTVYIKMQNFPNEVIRSAASTMDKHAHIQVFVLFLCPSYSITFIGKLISGLLLSWLWLILLSFIPPPPTQPPFLKMQLIWFCVKWFSESKSFIFR